MRIELAGGTLSPEWTRKLLAPYGKNSFGEPIFRIVFSSRRISIMGGYWNLDGIFSYRLAPRYPNRQCWVLERWLHPRNYGTPNSWIDETITVDGYLAVGPYPKEGVYECAFLFDQVPLRPDTLRHVLGTIQANRFQPRTDMRNRLEADARGEEADLDRAFEEEWDRTHGVRRGLSIGYSGALTAYNEEIQRYIERLVACPVKIQRKDFEGGFKQTNGENYTD